MKNKKQLLIICGIVIIIAVIAIISIQKKQRDNKIKEVLTEFINNINNKEYEKMYEKVTDINIEKEDFISRNKNIYEGIGSQNIQIKINKIEKEDKDYKVDYNEIMYTEAGKIEFDNSVNVSNDYKMKWTSKMIFPQLEDNEKVRISTLKAKRGDILDRNDVKLATDGTILSVGIVPGKLGENKDQNIKNISELTDVSEDYIYEKLNESWVKDDTFVPIKKISQLDTVLKNKLLEISGIQINDIEGRVYSLGKEAGHLIGYVQPINAEELEQNEGKGYTTNSLIGKSGLEKAYEETLRGIDGAEIYITNAEGEKEKEIAKQDKKDGKDVKLTIDSNLQKNLYTQIEEDNGFFVAMEPQSGELLALVSTPTYDSNEFVLGITDNRWKELNDDDDRPLYNRFIQKYCPGSTFKPITGAIALNNGKITADEDYGYSGTSWQKDNSWGDYNITTLTAYNGPKNLLNGLIYSDNIYFAQTALKIGADIYAESLNKLGFNEQIEFPMDLAKSQYADNNGDSIKGETKLADSGYGQGSILVNPIHMASIYSAFANDGNMIKPYIEYDGKSNEGKIWKQNVITKDVANTIKNDLIQVVENPNGTAHDMKINNTTIAGKTGTAELKTSSDDKESGTLAWFDCFTTDRSEGNNLLIISMVENEQNNQSHGTHYIIPKIRNVLTSIN